MDNETNNYFFSVGKILIACEESQTITIALRKAGFEAFSCDILPPSGGHPEWHIQGDAIKEAYSGRYSAMIAHPPCTYLTVTGNKWFYHPDDKHLPVEQRRPHPRFPDRQEKQKEAVDFFMKLYNAPIKQIAIENPVGIMSTLFRKPDQYVHPYYFGDPHSKKTGLWLKNFPLLKKTNVVEPKMYIYKDGRKDPLWHVESLKLPANERCRVRSKTFQGIAGAIVSQWFLQNQSGLAKK